MDELNLIKIRECPACKEEAAFWFHQKWGIPFSAYLESMEQCIAGTDSIPQWYAVYHQQHIAAGAGVIENDFHNRKDLSPNLCALYVEPSYRNQGLARYMLNFIREDLYGMGIEKLYLVTDHTEFYEKCGWTFFTLVEDEEGGTERMYTADTKPR